MRVKLDRNTDGVGGVARVYAGLNQYLPGLGVEIVNDTDLADVIHAHIAIYEKIPVEKPLVVSSHGMLWDEHGWGQSADTINRMCIEAYRQADVITAPSQFIARAIARNMSLPVEVVRHGIDSNQWLPAENGNYVLWNKARIDPANNPQDINMLAEMARDVQFVSTYANAASNIKIVGQIPYQNMQSYVASAGVYLDTPKESGGPCFGILEAMSCGVPILSWDWGGTSEAIVHKETGYLAKPNDYLDLVNGLYFCLRERERLGANARQVVLERYQWPQVITGYIHAYEQAIAKHHHPVKVSVIIPCYNLGKFLPACLESVQQQSFTDWEAIIVDDCSTDNSLKVAQGFARKDSRFKVLHNVVNQHVSYSRNKGILNSGGEYILPLDADDRLEVHALRNMVSILDTQRSIDIVAGKLLLFNETDLQTGWQGEWPNNAEFKLQITGYNRLPYSSMYRRKIWENIGGYRTRIRNGVEDADFWTRAMSFGARAKIIDAVTLWYTLRSNSLGKQNDKGTEAWLPWFGWAANPDTTPFGAVRESLVVRAYDKPEVSVVIPVGPGHRGYLQTCLDSLLAQTNPNWEAVVVNDTGEKWGELLGAPFITLVDSDKNEGVAAARNRGIRAARADKIIFLDVDDVAQPSMIDLLLHAHQTVGGWIYADWYVMDGGEAVLHESLNWNINHFRVRMLSPITGLYEKAHLLEVGGFDETAPGWEDWDLQLALVSHGYCGTRLQYPIITYNMQAGFRREENFSRADNLLQYIKTKYGDKNMACSKCGGKATLKVNTDKAQADNAQMVLLSYTGPMSQIRTFNSKNHPSTRYKVSNQKPFYVFADDVSYFLSIKDFKVVEQPKTFASTESAVLVSQEQIVDIPLENLPLKPETLAFLKNEYRTVTDVKRATDADLLKIRGIGPARLKEIREAVHA